MTNEIEKPTESLTNEDAVFDMAKALYTLYTGNHPTINCNRFPSWEDASAAERKHWWTIAIHMNRNGYTKRDVFGTLVKSQTLETIDSLIADRDHAYSENDSLKSENEALRKRVSGLE